MGEGHIKVWLYVQNQFYYSELSYMGIELCFVQLYVPHINSIRCTKSQSKTKAHYHVFFLSKGLRYLNILFYTLTLWCIKCHCCRRNPSLEFLICHSISKRFYLHWKAFYLLSKIRYILIMGGGTAGSLWHHQTCTCQPPEYKNLETSWNLCIVRISFLTMSEYSLKITPRTSECSRCW